jgi:hypothetical protein
MTRRSPLLFGLVALALTACAMAVARPSVGTVGAEPDRARTFRCVLDMVQQNGTVAYEAILVADTDRTGHYQLTVKGHAGQVLVTQSGHFAVQAGQTLTLGAAELTGRATDYHTAFTLRSDGGDHACPSRL